METAGAENARLVKSVLTALSPKSLKRNLLFPPPPFFFFYVCVCMCVSQLFHFL